MNPQYGHGDAVPQHGTTYTFPDILTLDQAQRLIQRGILSRVPFWVGGRGHVVYLVAQVEGAAAGRPWYFLSDGAWRKVQAEEGVCSPRLPGRAG
jgi:hypothetical protein